MYNQPDYELKTGSRIIVRGFLQQEHIATVRMFTDAAIWLSTSQIALFFQK